MEVYGLQIIVFIDYLVGRLDKQVGLRFIYPQGVMEEALQKVY